MDSIIRSKSRDIESYREVTALLLRQSYESFGTPAYKRVNVRGKVIRRKLIICFFGIFADDVATGDAGVPYVLQTNFLIKIIYYIGTSIYLKGGGT